MMNNRIEISKKTKTLIVLLIVVVLVSCFVPLYQACIYQQNQYKLGQEKQSIEMLEEKIRILNARISYLKTPEALITQVIEQKLDYRSIDYNSSYRIARSL